jgi:hypothetical protein
MADTCSLWRGQGAGSFPTRSSTGAGAAYRLAGLSFAQLTWGAENMHIIWIILIGLAAGVIAKLITPGT